MRTIFVTTQGAKIRRISRRLRIEREGEPLAEIPIARVERLFVYGGIVVTAQALALALDAGVRIAWFSSTGRYRGSLSGPRGKDVFLRAALFDARHDAAFRSRVAAELVRDRCAAARALLRRHADNHPDEVLRDCARRIEELEGRISPDLPTEQLRGLEGEAAALWYTGLARMLRVPTGFAGRRRRPPPDPVNAVIGYLSVVVAAEAQGLCEAYGLDPAIGLLHELRYGRASLAFDVMEPLRPWVDRFVVTLFNLRVLDPERDFVRVAGGGIQLRDRARRTLLDRYELRLARPGVGSIGLRRRLAERIERLRGHLRAWADAARARGG